MIDAEKLKVLIIHPLKVVAEFLSFLVESEYNCQTVISPGFAEANKALEETSFAIVLAAIEAEGETCFNFFDKLVDLNEVSLFFIIDNNKEIKKSESRHNYKNKTPSGILSEDRILQTLVLALNEALCKSEATPKEWTTISPFPLTRFSVIPADVFIQLNSGRYLKLFNRHDKISLNDVERYMGKGVNKFYLKRQAFQWLVKQIDKVMPEIVANPEGEIVLPELEEELLEEEFPKLDNPFEMEKKFIDELHQTSQKVLLQIKKNPDLAKLLKNMKLNRNSSFFKNRIDLVCNISCALARELTWSSDAMFEKLIYVSYVHDLTLMSHPKLARIQTLEELETMTDLTVEEKRLFLNHPKAVAEIVSRDKRAPSEAAIIISQHHERANSKGFPEGLQGVRIIPTAALLEISINFAQYIIDNPKWDFENYALYKSHQFRGGPFTKIFRALEKICLKMD